MKRLLLLLLLLPLKLFGQGTALPIPPTLGPQGFPKAGATISICTYQANAVPCTNYANVYLDQALTLLVNQTTAPITTDGLGNCCIVNGSLQVIWALPGQYHYTVSGVGIAAPQGPYIVTAACFPGAQQCNNFTGLPNTPLAFSATPSFAASSSVSYSMTLIGNVTSSTISGTPINGILLSLTLVEDATGSRTFSFPSNFVFPVGYTFDTTALHTNALTFKFDGTNWNLISNSGTGGGGGGSPGAPVTCLQKNGGGNFVAANVCESSALFVNEDTASKGPNPSFDIRSYGAVADNISGTASCNGTTTITTTAILGFVNSEGINVLGCGPTPTLPAAPTPTVTTGNTEDWAIPNAVLNSATSSNSESVIIVLRDLDGGIGLPGTATTISNALPLGMQSGAVTSCTGTGFTVSCTLTSAQLIAANAQVRLTGTNNIPLFTGLMTLTSVTGGGTVINGNWANYCATSCSSTGGTLTWLNGVQVTFTLPAAPTWQAYICVQRQGEGSYHVRGVTDPILGNYTGSGYNAYQTVNPAQNTWTDWGATMSNPSGPIPTYVPDAICTNGSVTNDFLSTTIVSGAGTTSLVVANAASQTSSGQTIVSDNAPAILAADAAAASGAFNRGTVYIPDTAGVNFGEFNVHTPIVLNSLVDLAGNINTSETITVKGKLAGRFTGYNCGQFDFSCRSRIRGGGAFPLVLVNSQNAPTPSTVVLQEFGNANKVLLISNGNNTPIGPDLSLNTGNSSDYCGMGLEVTPSAFNTFLTGFIDIQSGPNQIDMSSWCPSAYFMGTNTAPNIGYIDGNLSIQSRGIVVDGGNFGITWQQRGIMYGQGCVMPPINFINANIPQYDKTGNTTCDTSVEPNYSAMNIGNGGVNPGNMSIKNCRNTSGSGQPCYEGTVQAVPNLNDDPFVPATSNLAPNTVGRTKTGQEWANYYTLVPALSIPIPSVGFNFGFLGTDTLPSFKDISGNIYRTMNYLSTVSWTNGHCTQASITAGVVSFTDSGAGCGSTGGNPGGLTNALQYNGGAVFAGVNSPIVNGSYLCGYVIVASTAVPPTCNLPGIPVNAQTGASYSLAPATDRAAHIRHSGTTTSTDTLCQITGTCAVNFPFVDSNFNSGNLTLQTNAADKIDGSATGGTQTVLPGWVAYVYQDSSSAPGNWFTLRMPMISAFPACADTSGNHLNFTSGGGITCGTSSGASAGVTSITGDGSLITNSASAGVVTLTLGNAGAHKWWGNNTGSTAAPGYQTIGAADIPATIVYNNQANTYTGGGLQDFSAMTWKIPTSAGFTAGATTMFGYDSTGEIIHCYTHNADANCMATTATDTTATHAAFASSTAGLYTTRAIANADLPTISFDKSATGLVNPTADATFTQPAASTTGWTLAGTAPASVSTSTGTAATTLFNVNGVTGGADSNASGTAGVGSAPTITAGNGGAGTGTNTVGGAGGSLVFTAGNGGASAGTGANSNGGNLTFTPGAKGTGGSGTAGKAGVVQSNDTSVGGFVFYPQGTVATVNDHQIPANSIVEAAPGSVTAYTITKPGVAPVNNNSAQLYSNASPGVGAWAKMPQTAFLTSNYTNATTTFSNVTNLSFSVEANTNYHLQCNLDYQTSASTADVKIQWTGPSSPTAVTYDLVTEVTGSTLSASVATAFSTALSEAGTPTITTNFPLTLTMTLINGANAGTIQLQAAATGTGTITIIPGSCQLQ